MEGPAAHPAAAVARHVAPGGWRRIVTGVAVGVAAGLLVRTAAPASSTANRDGRRG